MEKVEIYIRLGEINNIILFVHIIEEYDLFTSSISHHIYNSLINYKFITSPDKNVIIFDIDKFKSTANLVSIQHINNKNLVNYDKGDMEYQLVRFINEPRSDNELYFISYDYDIGGYNGGLADSNKNKDIINMLRLMVNIKKPTIDDMEYIITVKKIEK